MPVSNNKNEQQIRICCSFISKDKSKRCLAAKLNTFFGLRGSIGCTIKAYRIEYFKNSILCSGNVVKCGLLTARSIHRFVLIFGKDAFLISSSVADAISFIATFNLSDNLSTTYLHIRSQGNF